ncbi:Putative NAD(P)-binding domain, NAD(P)-binding domain superfamily [Septoria linicola]|uniref:NAD(P)-binding domain, NAD(P)-binding domain superfamily n=1 Tax=Septoria linicola TaxID=215465 RepID=A0A9Q9EM56_9PEZI|nr:putative NAD(P)-binding domain, NAD(P)-binding domain superfamily [Septoria linicola]USW55172.1 Putative NAD(P)-binding domain, NAD(P)-binding domain superfamily [Septoria linicola]
MPHHFLVLGATGPSGIIFLETALQAGHNLTVYARSPEKLPQHIRSLALSTNASPQVQIIKGNFDASSKSALTQAIRSGATHLVSFAGPAIPAKGTPITEFYEKVLYPLIQEDEEATIKRVMVLSTPSFKVPNEGDRFSIKWWFGVQFVYWLFGSAWAEVNGIGNATKALNGLEWTVFRVPGLTNGHAGAVRAGYVGVKGDGMVLSRKSMAVWVLQEVDERKWVGKSPAISNAGGWF